MLRDLSILMFLITAALGVPAEATTAVSVGDLATCDSESREEWNTKDCEREDSYRCAGACGKGCKSCTVEYVPGFCGWMCETIILSCYTRPCCAEHDACLDAAQSFEEEVECHAQALANGCTTADADGETGDLPDAEPTTVELCVSLFQPDECAISVVPFEH